MSVNEKAGFDIDLVKMTIQVFHDFFVIQPVYRKEREGNVCSRMILVRRSISIDNLLSDKLF